MHSITVPASMEHLDRVMSVIGQFLEEAGCKEHDKRLIEISAEEIFTNIASYAYGGKEGPVWIQLDISMEGGKREAVISFKDQGLPYNPFARKDPDLKLPLEERPIGGLGVYMVKQFMDRTEYQHREGYNMTIITKGLSIEELENQVFGDEEPEAEELWEKGPPPVFDAEHSEAPEDGEPVMISMTLEDGTEAECRVKGVFLEGEKEYIALEAEEGQITIMELLAGEGEDIGLAPVEDEEEQKRAIEAFWEYFGEPETEQESISEAERENEDDEDQDRQED